MFVTLSQTVLAVSRLQANFYNTCITFVFRLAVSYPPHRKMTAANKSSTLKNSLIQKKLMQLLELCSTGKHMPSHRQEPMSDQWRQTFG